MCKTFVNIKDPFHTFYYTVKKGQAYLHKVLMNPLFVAEINACIMSSGFKCQEFTNTSSFFLTLISICWKFLH